jgi:archaellum component FlaC
MAVDHSALKEKLAEDEQVLRSQLNSHTANAEAQMKAIVAIKSELKALDAPKRKDVEQIMQRIEAVDRDLSYVEADFKAKKAAADKASEILEKKKKEKRLLTDHMRLILYESEKEKVKKIAKIREKLRLAEEAMARSLLSRYKG